MINRSRDLVVSLYFKVAQALGIFPETRIKFVGSPDADNILFSDICAS